MSPPRRPTLFPVHAVLYALLCATLVRGWRLQRVPHTYSGPFVATLVYGIIHELVQLLVPYRHASISDVVADAVGALAALALIALIDRRRTRSLWAPAAYR